MTDQELIAKLQSLKEIKPRENWVLFAKHQISSQTIIPNQLAMKVPVWESLKHMFLGKRLVYAFATLAVLAVGSIGMLQSGIVNNTGSGVEIKNTAALVQAKSNVEIFKEKSRNLATVAKNDLKAISLAVDDVKAAAQQLTETIKKDPQVAKEVALEINNNKTYLNVEGTGDLEATSLSELYRTITVQLIEDYKKMSLPEDKQKSLKRIEDLINQEGFTEFDSVLEDALLLGASLGDN